MKIVKREQVKSAEATVITIPEAVTACVEGEVGFKRGRVSPSRLESGGLTAQAANRTVSGRVLAATGFIGQE